MRSAYPDSLFPLVGALVIAASCGANEAAHIIPEAVSCPSCSIEMTSVAISKDTPDEIDKPIEVNVDSRGRIWVFFEQIPAKVFDANGKFLRSIGRLGAGPGEYASGGYLVQLPHDTVAVITLSNLRASIVSPELVTVRAFQMPFMPGKVRRIDDSLLVSTGYVWSPPHEGNAIHFVRIDSASLNVTRSFAPTGKPPRPETGGSEFSWQVSPSKEGRFWTLERDAYRLRLWDRNGDSVMALERRAPWFPERQYPKWDGKPDFTLRPPQPVAVGISESDGVLWTFIRVADPDWKAAWENVRPGQEGRGPESSETDDTIIEAIDVPTRRVLARRRIGSAVWREPSGGRFTTWDVDSAGESQLLLHTLRLRR